MPVYISMLRGVNVGGHNRMKMDQLRRLFSSLGCEQAQTYIQSGNLVFRAARQSPRALSQKLEKSIQEEFGFSVDVVTRTAAEMGATIRDNPFLKRQGVDVSKLHVTFLSQAPDAAALKKLTAVEAGPDEFSYSGEVIYLYCLNRYSDTRLSNSFLEKVLAVRATTRNWATVNQLYEMAVECV